MRGKHGITAASRHAVADAETMVRRLTVDLARMTAENEELRGELTIQRAERGKAERALAADLSALKRDEIDALRSELAQERMAHGETREQLQEMRRQRATFRTEREFQDNTARWDGTGLSARDRVLVPELNSVLAKRELQQKFKARAAVD